MPQQYLTSLLAILMSTTAPLMADQSGSAMHITVRPGENRLNVLYGDRVRLAGGHPLFQSKTLPASRLTGGGETYLFSTDQKPVTVSVMTSDNGDIASFYLSPNGNQSADGNQFLGLFFDQIPDFEKGVEIWRYKPWNSWTKPVSMGSPRQMHEWDVQFFYWKYADDIYGAAIPLSGKGYRSTLGQEGGAFGSKSVSYFDKMESTDIPQLAIGFGPDPYALFGRLYEEGLSRMGRKEDLRKTKSFPSILEMIGWCTWNSSNLGKDLNEDLLLRAARSFAEGHFPVGWFLVDDGWFDQDRNMLNSLEPNRVKFPRGFRPIIDTLKEVYHLKAVGVWHAFNGYWQGINPESPLGKRYQDDLIRWREKVRPDLDSSAWRTCAFISPYAASLQTFYHDFHRYLKDQGFSFVKVDHQMIVERMAVGNFPIWDGAERYHRALNASVAETFGNAVINCMDMTADAYFNFGITPIARAVEDYFPYEEGESYDLQRGNAAAHVLQAAYNALYFSQMVYPDFDMFQSHNPNAVFHAIARAISNGPIYLTDDIGRQKFDVLLPLIYGNGKIIRADQSLMPTEDCLFQVQEPKPFKAFSMAGTAGLLGIWNCADVDSVTGTFKPSDVHALKGESFAVYEYFSKELTFAGRDDAIPVTLGRLGYELYYVLPLNEGNAVIGLVNKYNAPAAVVRSEISAKGIHATVYDEGPFAAVVMHSPSHVTVDGKPAPFRYLNNMVLIDIPHAGAPHERTVEIIFE